MKRTDIIWCLISLFVAIASFLTSNNFIIAVSLLLIYILYYFLIARKKLDKYYSKIDRIHTCYHFINSFLVTLSVKESFDEAYQSAIRIDNKNLNDQSENMNNLNIYDRVNCLRSYFNLAIYKMFLNILDLYQDQGGNVLTMSGNLIRECTRTEKTLSETLSIGKKHIVEFITLWIMSFSIILFMRFAITDFYVLMLKEPLFIIMLFIFYLVCLGSIHLFIGRYTNLSIKEDNGE